jgi:heme-degrading monooxygenase HmoA
MFVLHVKIKLKAGEGAVAERVYTGPFKMAISAQPGFRDVQFLRPEGEGDPILSIAFENQALQQQWVATDLHARVWGEMEKHFDGYTLATFTTA